MSSTNTISFQIDISDAGKAAKKESCKRVRGHIRPYRPAGIERLIHKLNTNAAARRIRPSFGHEHRGNGTRNELGLLDVRVIHPKLQQSRAARDGCVDRAPPALAALRLLISKIRLINF